MNGWHGRVLYIDLSSKRYEIIKPDYDVYKRYLGGRGLAGYYLSKYFDYTPLLFFNGPLTGTEAQTSSRICVMAVSPLTRTIFDESAGGKFSIMLKKAGYDGLILTGTLKENESLIINNDSISFAKSPSKDGYSVAEHTYAAEKRVKYASIKFDDNFYAHRGGLGLSMAEKNLKSILVRGDRETKIADKDMLESAVTDIERLINASPALTGKLGISNFGTVALYDLFHMREMLGDNFFRMRSDKGDTNAFHMLKEYGDNGLACEGCRIACKKMSDDGFRLPEYDGFATFLSIGCSLEEAVEACKMCYKSGIDPITSAHTIAMYKKYIKNADTLKLLDIIPDNDLLRTGSYRMAKEIGIEPLTVKKLELPPIDPRGAYGLALSYATSNKGASYRHAYPITHEILRKPVATDRFTMKGKAKINIITENATAAADSLTVCGYTMFSASLEEYAKALTAVTGVDFSSADLMEAGDRIFMNEKEINWQLGFSKNEDCLPDIFFEEGYASLNPINIKDFEEELESYYKNRGIVDA